MSSRLEKRFEQATAGKLADPILLSGLDPSLIDDLQNTEAIRDVVDAVIRQQWLQVHPDLASSPAERRQREAARGALEEALTQLKSADFGRCLREYRDKFPARVVDSPSSFIQSFSVQFQPLERLMRTGHKEIPLTALREVTIELFDLPRLAREIDRELSRPPRSTMRRHLQELLHQTPETMTFATIEGFTLGTREFLFDETGFGRTLYKSLRHKIKASGDPELQPLYALFNLSEALDADIDLVEQQSDELVARHAHALTQMWNSALTEDAVCTSLDKFAARNKDIVQQSLVAIDVARLRDLARNMPLKRLYIDSSGRFNEGKESGSLHTAPKLHAALIKYSDGLCDMEDDEPLDEPQQGAQGFINHLIYAALDERVRCSILHPLQLPDGPTLLISRELGIEAKRKKGNPNEVSHKVRQSRSGVSGGRFRLPGSEYNAEDIFYSAHLGYPPTVPSSFFSDAPVASPIDVVNPTLLTSHRTNHSGESFFCLEGLIHRIHRGT